MNLRNLVLGLLLVAAVVLSMVWDQLPMAGPSGRLELVPRDGWRIRSEDTPMTPLENKWLAGAQGLKRLYQFEGSAWLLAVTDGSRNRQAVHDPAYCFRGDGWTVSGQRAVHLDRGSGELLSLVRRGESLEVLYWFDDGGAPFSSLPEYWLKTTLRRLTRGLSGPEPLLFVLRPLHEDPDWDAVVERLAPALSIPK